MKDYTNYDYNALVARMTEILAEKEGWGDGYESSVGQTLIQLMADVTDNLQFMLERRSQEAFIDTARLRTSIVAHSSELGYRPRRKVSSTGTVRLSLLDENDNPLTAQGDIKIPANTALAGVDELFVTTRDVVIQAGDQHIDIPIKEGVLIEQTFDFNARPYRDTLEIVITPYDEVEEYSITVVDSTNTEFVDVFSESTRNRNITSLSYAQPSDALYDVKYGVDGMRLIFGDGEFGKKPAGTVRTQWVRSKGEDVDVISVGTDFVMTESEFLYDDSTISPQIVYRYSIENITPIRGGNSEESIKDISRNAPIFTRTANRAVTNDDYEFVVLRSGIGDIVDVHSFGEHELNSLVYKMNNVYLSYVTSDNQPLNLEQIRQLRTYIDRFKTITTHAVIAEADKLQAVLDVGFKRNTRLPITDSHLYGVVKKAINDYFKLERGSISKGFQHSELVKYIQDLTYEFKGITYQITDFVNVDMKAQYRVSPANTLYDVLIEIDNSYVPVQGNSFVIVLDGETFFVSIDGNDTLSDIIEKMRDKIFENTNFLLSTDGNVLRIKSPFIDYRFELNITFGDIASYVTSDVVYQLPNPRSEFSDEDGIYPGSAVLVDQDNTVLYEDDGNGNMVSVSTSDSFGINYQDSTLISPPTSNDYYLRYDQDRWQNVTANDNTVIILYDFPDSINDASVFSNLEVL